MVSPAITFTSSVVYTAPVPTGGGFLTAHEETYVEIDLSTLVGGPTGDGGLLNLGNRNPFTISPQVQIQTGSFKGELELAWYYAKLNQPRYFNPLTCRPLWKTITGTWIEFYVSGIDTDFYDGINPLGWNYTSKQLVVRLNGAAFVVPSDFAGSLSVQPFFELCFPLPTGLAAVVAPFFVVAPTHIVIDSLRNAYFAYAPTTLNTSLFELNLIPRPHKTTANEYAPVTLGSGRVVLNTGDIADGTAIIRRPTNIGGQQWGATYGTTGVIAAVGVVSGSRTVAPPDRVVTMNYVGADGSSLGSETFSLAFIQVGDDGTNGFWQVPGFTTVTLTPPTGSVRGGFTVPPPSGTDPNFCQRNWPWIPPWAISAFDGFPDVVPGVMAKI